MTKEIALEAGKQVLIGVGAGMGIFFATYGLARFAQTMQHRSFRKLAEHQKKLEQSL